MTWNYSGDPTTSETDAVRFRVGDTDSTDQLVTDEEIVYALGQYGSVLSAAASICEGIAAKFARKVDRSVGDLRIAYSQRVTQYRDMAASLRRDAASTSVQVYAGGISVSDKETVAEDTDRVKPAFRRGMFDDPGGTDPIDPPVDWTRTV